MARNENSIHRNQIAWFEMQHVTDKDIIDRDLQGLYVSNDFYHATSFLPRLSATFLEERSISHLLVKLDRLSFFHIVFQRSETAKVAAAVMMAAPSNHSIPGSPALCGCPMS
jgi:hypothetical protein